MKTMSCTTLVAALVAGGAVVGYLGDASAVCRPDTIAGDVALFEEHQCWVDFFQWHYKAYNTIADDWRDRGFFDACNSNLEYAKHWNAAYIIENGIVFDKGFAGRAFHDGRADYGEVARARSSSEWHAEFRHQAVDVLCIEDDCRNGTAMAMWKNRFGKINLLQTACVLYQGDSAESVANPAHRAADFIHEGWHAWKDRHGMNSGHDIGGSMDFFFPHEKGLYASGEMHEQKSGDNQSHSVFQAEWEFLCDIADMPSSHTPLVVRKGAEVFANSVARNNLRFPGPPATCGSSLQLSGPPPSSPPGPCTNGVSCTADAQCGQGFCRSDGCCQVIH